MCGDGCDTSGRRSFLTALAGGTLMAMTGGEAVPDAYADGPPGSCERRRATRCWRPRVEPSPPC